MKIYKSNIPELTIKYKKSELKKVKIKSSEDAYEYFKLIFDADTIDYRESFHAVFLNRSNNTIAWMTISTGGLAGTIADPRMIIKTALDVGAHALLISHNHPSGNLKPGTPDIELTKKIKEGAELFNIALLDHIIISSEGYYSFGDKD